MPCMLSPCQSDAPVAGPHNIASSYIAQHFSINAFVHHSLLNPVPLLQCVWCLHVIQTNVSRADTQ